MGVSGEAVRTGAVSVVRAASGQELEQLPNPQGWVQATIFVEAPETHSKSLIWCESFIYSCIHLDEYIAIVRESRSSEIPTAKLKRI